MGTMARVRRRALRAGSVVLAIALSSACANPSGGRPAPTASSAPRTAPATGSAAPRAPESTSAAPSEKGGWADLPASPLSRRHGAVGLWVDGAFVVLGGRDTDPCPPGAGCVAPPRDALSDGARFDPGTGTWTAIAPAPIPVEYASASVVRNTVYLWVTQYSKRGRLESWFVSYDAAADTWNELPAPPNPTSGLAIAAAGESVVGYLTSHEGGDRGDVMFDPSSDAWEPIPPDPLAPSFDRQIIAVGQELVLLAQDLVDQPGSAEPSVVRAAVLDSARREWRLLPDSEVSGGWGPWFAIGDRLVNPTPGGADGGANNNWGRTYPFGGILDVAGEEWLPLPEAPNRREDVRLPPVADDQLGVSALAYAYDAASQELTAVTLPESVGEEGQAAAVGEGRLYVWGGVRWSDDGTIMNTGSTWAPPPR